MVDNLLNNDAYGYYYVENRSNCPLEAEVTFSLMNDAYFLAPFFGN